MKTIRIGSRDSKLAVIQAEEIMARLGTPCELITMKTTGDMILDRPLDQVGGKGLFVRELDRALAEKRVDLTVHSLKDMPMEQPVGMPIAAYSPREDARDVLVLPLGKTKLDPALPLGCSSARRRVQLRALYPDFRVEPVRGNIQTRLRKLDEGQYGGLILAAAGLHRLGLQVRISRYFSPEELLPAAGQAILAVQGRENELVEAVRAIDCAPSRACALAERAFVRTLDGGCFAPIAAYAEVEGDALRLRGLYAAEDRLYRGERCGTTAEAEEIGTALAEELRARANGGAQ